MILKVEWALKHTKTTETKYATCENTFHQPAAKNQNVNVVKTIYCQRSSIFLQQKKKNSIHYLPRQNRGLSGLKNIWLVIMTGDLLSVIFSPLHDAIFEKSAGRKNKSGIFSKGVQTNNN